MMKLYTRFFAAGVVVMLAAAAVFSQSDTAHFIGSIGDAKIEMELTVDGTALGGSYYYLRSGSANRLTLTGQIGADGNFTLQESDSSGKRTGEFTGKWNQDPNEAGASLEGQWRKPGQKGDGLSFFAGEQMIFMTTGHLTSREMHDAVPAKKAKLSAVYPELTGHASAAGFNQLVKASVLRSLAAFKKDLAGITAADVKMTGEIGNYIDVGYDVEYADDDIISLNFGEDTFEGGAHPNHNTFTITYDLKQGRELKLADLFKPGTKYLTVIADYTTRDLRSRKDPDSGENMGLAQDIFEDGVKPTEDNYKDWNITKKGLLFTFPPYQVAAYAFGPQSVIIPLAKLADIARPGGALSKAHR